MFKLAKIWPEFSYILVTVGNTLRKISSFSVLLLIFIFSFSILGAELFAAKLSFDDDGRPILDAYDYGRDNIVGNIPDWNFNSFSNSVISVFIVLANDGWSSIYFDHARVFREDSGSIAVPLIFFISLIMIGQNILFQLFLAILLQEFDERSMIAEENKKRDAANKQKVSYWDSFKLYCKKKGCPCCQDKPEQDEYDEDEDDVSGSLSKSTKNKNSMNTSTKSDAAALLGKSLVLAAPIGNGASSNAADSSNLNSVESRVQEKVIVGD